jgi:hypothetical protein
VPTGTFLKRVPNYRIRGNESACTYDTQGRVEGSVIKGLHQAFRFMRQENYEDNTAGRYIRLLIYIFINFTTRSYWKRLYKGKLHYKEHDHSNRRYWERHQINYETILDMRFSQQWLWRAVFSEIRGKDKVIPVQAVEPLKVVRGWGSNIF